MEGRMPSIYKSDTKLLFKSYYSIFLIVLFHICMNNPAMQMFLYPVFAVGSM